jgi:C1A family cysteine protease
MVLGTSWHWNMFDPDSSGYLRLGGGNAGGHAYLAVAVNRNRINPDRSDGGSIRILNSWGESWGQKGRAWITMADMATLLEDDGEAAMGVEIRVRS